MTMNTAISAPQTQPGFGGEMCVNCRGLDTEGSWVFFAMTGILLVILVYKLRIRKKK